MFYFKKIVSYLDYYESEEKRKNCGHIKLLVRDNVVCLEIQIKGLEKDMNKLCEIKAAGAENILLARIMLDKGTGYFCSEYETININGKSIYEITGLRIVIDDERECRTTWVWDEVPENVAESEQQGESEGEAKSEQQEESENEAESEQHEEAKNGTGNVLENVIEKETKNLLKKGLDEKTENQEENQESVKRKLIPPLEDKWQQLCRTYPVCHPFGDGDCYITISPEDFVVLRKEYQSLVSNSFLLHGYHNYHHVILGKNENSEEDLFYIGVPGAYFDKDKRVAVMFGFEGFAQAENGQKQQMPIPFGAFGYYMRKVEI